MAKDKYDIENYNNPDFDGGPNYTPGIRSYDNDEEEESFHDQIVRRLKEIKSRKRRGLDS